MRFEEVLSNCIDALANGETVEACLARYPMHAEALASLLPLVVSLQTNEKPQLSAHAFEQARRTISSAAAAAQRTRPAPSSQGQKAPKPSRSWRAFRREPRIRLYAPNAHNGAQLSHRSNGFSKDEGELLHGSIKPLPARRTYVQAGLHYHLSQPRGSVQDTKRSAVRRGRHLVTTIVVLVLLFGSVLLLQSAAMSLPGTPLYPIKTLGEHAQGLLMSAAGESATWHATQMARRIDELIQLEARSSGADDTSTTETLSAMLVAQAAEQAQLAFDASARMSLDEQNHFYAQWLAVLESTDLKLRQVTNNDEAMTLVDGAMAQLAAARAENEQATSIEILNEENFPVTSAPTLTALLDGNDEPRVAPNMVTPTPALVATATPLPQFSISEPSVTPVLRATPVLRPTTTPTTNPQPVLTVPKAAPTSLSLPVFELQIPRESRSEDASNQSEGSDTNKESRGEEPAPDNNASSTDEGSSNSDAAPTESEEVIRQEEDGNSTVPPLTITATGRTNDEAQATVTALPTRFTAVATAVPPTATSVPAATVDSVPLTPETTDTASSPTEATTEPLDPDIEIPLVKTPVSQPTRLVPDATPVPEPVGDPGATPTPADRTEEQQGPEHRRTGRRRPSATATSASESLPPTLEADDAQDNSDAATAVAQPTDKVAP